MRRFAAVSTLLLAVGLMLLIGARGTRWRLAVADGFAGGYRLLESWYAASSPGGRFQRPIGVACAPDGTVYVTDALNRVVRFDSQGRVLGQWGEAGSEDGQFGRPVGVAVDGSGAVYVSDFELDRVQKFTRDGAFLLAFGEPGSEPGRFDAPAGLAAHGDRLYVADFYNHRIQVFDSEGRFERVIGRPGRLDGGALHYPTDAAVTPTGELLVADTYNFRLQWFSTAGAGLARAGYHLLWSWPRPASGSAGFDAPSGVAVGPEGTIHAADSGNHRIVMLTAEGHYADEYRLPRAGPVYSPEHLAVSPDGSRVYATDLAGDRLLVLEVKP